MADEVEIYLQHPYAVRHGQRGEAADGGIEGDVPRVVDRRHKGEANLAHDLEPKLESGAGIAPLSLRKCRPNVCGGRGRCGCVGESRVHRHLVETSYPIGTVSESETWTQLLLCGDFVHGFLYPHCAPAGRNTMQGAGKGLWFPRSRNRDLGHPATTTKSAAYVALCGSILLRRSYLHR